MTAGGMITAQNVRCQKPAKTASRDQLAKPATSTLKVPCNAVIGTAKPKRGRPYKTKVERKLTNSVTRIAPLPRHAAYPNPQQTPALSLNPLQSSEWTHRPQGRMLPSAGDLHCIDRTVTCHSSMSSPLAGATPLSEPTDLSPKAQRLNGLSPSLPGDDQPLELTTEVSRVRELQRELERGRTVTLSDTPTPPPLVSPGLAPPIRPQAPPLRPPPAHNGVLHPIVQNGGLHSASKSSPTNGFKPLYKSPACNVPILPRPASKPSS